MSRRGRMFWGANYVLASVIGGPMRRMIERWWTFTRARFLAACGHGTRADVCAVGAPGYPTPPRWLQVTDGDLLHCKGWRVDYPKGHYPGGWRWYHLCARGIPSIRLGGLS